MQMDWIETFLDLCETRSFTATAERLGLRQSSVSGRVVALERKLGAKLFRRGRAGTELTTAGLRFEPHARALAMSWVEAGRAVQDPGNAALTLRIGMQPDLALGRVGAWLSVIRTAMPQAALYLEAGFSVSMCADILSGVLDVALVFTPTQHPDLHVETLADLPYQLVSSEGAQLRGVPLESYILPDYSDAFLHAHTDALPDFSSALLSSGQTDLSLGMLRSLGGSTYLPAAQAEALIAEGGWHAVADAPPLSQRVYGAVHLKNRHRRPHRRVLRAMVGAM